MSDSLNARVGRVIAGGVHALIDKLEDRAPEAVMEQSLREADAVVDEVRHELGRVTANRHLAQQQHARLNAQHSDLEGQIGQALASSREDFARAAVARQLDIEAQLPVLESNLGEMARQESELQGYVSALLAKKREMQEALTRFRESRAASSSAAGNVSAGTTSQAEIRMGRVGEAFDRIYERQTGLSPVQRGAGLQQAAQLKELDDFVRDNQIAQRLAQIKASQSKG